MTPPRHKDRLSAIDTSFLDQEKGTHMHIGGVLVFEGPPPRRADFIAHVESRLHLVPRYRQKLAWPRLEMGRPLWVDDPRFTIDYHIRHTALPPPGSEEELRMLTARVFSQRLDRTKPLWELWLVQGLPDDRFAVISKVHHALVDGVSGMDLTTVMFDLEPDTPPTEPVAWTPHPEPSDAELIAEGVKSLSRVPGRLIGGALDGLRHPRRATGAVGEELEAVGEVGWALLAPAPKTPLNVPIGTHRRVLWVRRELAEFKAIKNALGGTVNDVFLSVVAGALGRWLRARGVRTEGLELRGCVPVSVRAKGDEAALGNKITMMRGPLPVYARDPVARHRIVCAAMEGLKESKQALGAEVISDLEDFAPPTLLAQSSRLNFSNRVYNVLVTNVPGPQFPLYLRGRKLLDLCPVAFLAPQQALAIAMMSYHGTVGIGLIGDYDALDDIDDVGRYLQDSLDELTRAATDAGEEQTVRAVEPALDEPARADHAPRETTPAG